jgi:hypothetical protein
LAEHKIIKSESEREQRERERERNSLKQRLIRKSVSYFEQKCKLKWRRGECLPLLAVSRALSRSKTGSKKISMNSLDEWLKIKTMWELTAILNVKIVLSKCYTFYAKIFFRNSFVDYDKIPD